MARLHRKLGLLLFCFLLLSTIHALVPVRSEKARHFVLVHGVGHGAWCWYKVTTALQAHGHSVTALDLTSSGKNKVVADTVADTAHYVQPLTDFLRDYEGRVVLVGHSLGGSAISYAMEAHPDKIEKAIFVAALMPVNGQTFIPITTFVARITLLSNRIFTLKFGNGLSLPTSALVNLDKAQANFYNRSPPEDVYLAYSCLNPAPFRPSFNVLTLTESRYGSIPRFYIKTTDDNIFPPDTQESFVRKSPPQGVFTVPESDHSPFFSQPAALVKLLISIADS